MNSHHLLFSPFVSSWCVVSSDPSTSASAPASASTSSVALNMPCGARDGHTPGAKNERIVFLSSLKVSCFYRARSAFLSSASAADSTSSEHRYSHRPKFPPVVDGISACVLLRGYHCSRSIHNNASRSFRDPQTLSGHHIDDHCYCWLCVRLWWLLIGVQR